LPHWPGLFERFRSGGQTRNAWNVGKNETYLLIYPLLITVAAIALLVVIGMVGQFYWSYTLIFLAMACVLSEWQVIRLPQGDRLTLSIIFVLLALLLGFDEASSLKRAVGAIEVIAVGSLIGYGLINRPSFVHATFYVAHYVWSAFLAGIAFILVNEYVPLWFITNFHLPAVVAYIVVFSIVSTLMVGPLNARIFKGEKLPKADPLFVIFLAPIALIVYYFFQTRQFSILSLVILALPLLGVLVTFRLYINIDTGYGEVKQLYEISQSFLAAMSQEETVQRVSQSIAQAIDQLVECDACLVYTRSTESNEYLLANLDSGQHGPATVMPGHGLLGRILFGGTGDIVNDVAARDRLSSAERKWTSRTAVMAYPLFAENQAIGLMVLVRYRRGFTAEMFRIVGIVASQAGVALHNAQMYEQSLQMADRDRQLDILNQAAFMQRAQRAMGRAQLANQPIALLLADVDDFGKINNAFGHPTGDKVLAGVVAVMKQKVEDVGFIGRRGGEEFVVLLPNTEEQGALEMAERIRQGVQESVFRSDDGRDVQATVSTGVALFPRDATDIVSLDRLADRAAYLAKRMGKNRVCLYEDQKEKLELFQVSGQPQSLPESERRPAASVPLMQEQGQ
jgi:diguanylate cyclase (GGDEF)-like protein